MNALGESFEPGTYRNGSAGSTQREAAGDSADASLFARTKKLLVDAGCSLDAKPGRVWQDVIETDDALYGVIDQATIDSARVGDVAIYAMNAHKSFVVYAPQASDEALATLELPMRDKLARRFGLSITSATSEQQLLLAVARTAGVRQPGSAVATTDRRAFVLQALLWAGASIAEIVLLYRLHVAWESALAAGCFLIQALVGSYRQPSDAALAKPLSNRDAANAASLLIARIGVLVLGAALLLAPQAIPFVAGAGFLGWLAAFCIPGFARALALGRFNEPARRPATR